MNHIEALKLARDALTWLHDMAESGKAVDHLYDGDCPDQLDRTRRDPACPACKAMDKAAAALAALAALPAPSGEPLGCGYEACDCRSYCKRAAPAAQAAAPAPDHVPAGPEIDAATDAALDMVLLPPIRVSRRAYAVMSRIAEVRGMVLQAVVREALEPSDVMGAASPAPAVPADPRTYADGWRDGYARGYDCAGRIAATPQEAPAPQVDAVALAEAAFREGFYAPRTYNDTVLNTADDAWEEAKAALLRAHGITAPTAPAGGEG